MWKKQLSVLTLGDPRLRLRAEPVVTLDRDLQTLIKNLIWTAEKTNGVGIAAPQVGVAKDRKSTRLNSSHVRTSRMPSSA